MVSGTKSQRFSLADVLTSCLSSIGQEGNPLSLPSVDRAVVLLADGLGAHALKASAAYSRTLAPLLGKSTTALAGFPTTTASSLASLTTGLAAGEHGLVGYQALDHVNDRVVNQLNGWDSLINPSTWQRCLTVFERASDAGIPSFTIGAERYRNSGFTQAVLRGAEYRGADTIEGRLAEAQRVLDSEQRALIYVYVPELDQVAHKSGWQSSSWTDRLEELDAAVRNFVTGLGAREGLLVTADHGIIDVAQQNHVLVGDDSGLFEGIRHLAGEPRCLQLHFEPTISQTHQAALIERWRQSESSRAQVVTRQEAIVAGWFGPRVHPDVVPRIGDLLVAARKTIAYYDGRDESGSGRSMVGQHGSSTPEETLVPLLRFGAFG